jgi:8-oxo-dGTP diphosphatase
MLLRRCCVLAGPSRRASTRVMATKGSYTYEWPRPGLTVDVAVLAPQGPARTNPTTTTAPTAHLLLIQRGHPPAAGKWALPGGFVEPDECLDAAAARELREETTLDAAAGGGRGVSLRQVHAFGGPDRDPRGWTVTVAYAAVLPGNAPPPAVRGEDDAAAAAWWPVRDLPPLAFDHQKIVAAVLRSVAGAEAAGDAAFAGDLAAGAATLEARPWQPTRE